METLYHLIRFIMDRLQNDVVIAGINEGSNLAVQACSLSTKDKDKDRTLQDSPPKNSRPTHVITDPYGIKSIG